MKRSFKSMLSLLLSIAILASVVFVVPVQATADYTMRMVESTVDESNNIYKLDLYVKGYANTTTVGLAMAYDSDNIVLIDTWDKTSEAEEVSYAFETVIENRGTKVFTAQITTGTMADGDAGLYISAYNTLTNGYDLSTETHLLSMYYKVKDANKMNAASFRVLKTDAELGCVTSAKNVAGALVISKDSKNAYFAKHSENNLECSELDFQGFTYTGSAKDELKSVTVSTGDADVSEGKSAVPYATAGNKTIDFTAAATGLNGTYAGELAYRWSISNSAGVDGLTIDSNGVLTIPPAAAANVSESGTAITIKAEAVVGETATVKYGEYQLTLTREKFSVNSVSVSLEKNSLDIPEPEASDVTAHATATVRNQYGLDMDGETIEWSITKDGSAVTGASIDSGLVTVTSAAAAGNYIVTATAGGKSDSKILEVKYAASYPKTVAVTIDDSVTIPGSDEGNKTVTPTLAVLDQYGKDFNDYSVTWSVAPAADGVSIDTEDGQVTVTAAAKDSAGKYTVTASVSATVDGQTYNRTDNDTFTLARGESRACDVVIKCGETVLGTADTIVIPLTDTPNSKTYEAVAIDQYGGEMPPNESGSPRLYWEDEEDSDAKLPKGVTVVEDDSESSYIRIVSATKDTEADTSIVLKAEEYLYDHTKELEITFVAIEAVWSGVSAIGGEYGTPNKDLVSLPTGDLSYTLDGASGTLSGTWGVVDPDVIQGVGEKEVQVIFKVSNDASNGGYAGLTLTMPTTVKVTITAKSIDADDITVSGATFDGTAKTPDVTVGELVEDTDYTVIVNNGNDCINAGVYDVVIKGIGNYGGEITKKFVISPATISVDEIKIKTREYEADNTDCEVESVKYSDLVDGFDADVEEVTASDYADANAEEDKATEVTITLNEGNYCFGFDTDNNPVYSTTVDATGTVEQAEAPTVDDYEINVYYEDTNPISFDASDFELGEEDGWLNAEISATSFEDSDADDVISDVAVVDGTVTVTPAGAAEAGNESSFTVTVSSTNYEDATVTVKVSTINIAIPWPQNPTIKDNPVYGDTNADIISGFATTGTATTDKNITGKFSVKDADAAPEAGTTTVTLVFTADEGQGFGSFEKEYTLTNAVAKATITVTPKNGQSKEFGDEDPVFEYDYSEAQNGEEPGFTGALARESAEESAGEYEIVIGTLALEDNGDFKVSNYELEFVEDVVFTITAKEVGASISVAECIYNGQAQTPEITVTYVADDGSEVALTENDYEVVKWSNNTNAGTNASVTVKGKGDYSFAETKQTFEIKPLGVDVTLKVDEFTYNGVAPELEAVYADVNGEECSDVTVVEIESDAGSYESEVEIEDSNYTPNNVVSYVINPADADTEFEYDISGEAAVGEELTAEITINGNDVSDEFDIVWYAISEDEDSDDTEDGEGSDEETEEPAEPEEIGQGSSLELTDDVVGKKVFFVATSKGENVESGIELTSDPTEEIDDSSIFPDIDIDIDPEAIGAILLPGIIGDLLDDDTVKLSDINNAKGDHFNNLLQTYGSVVSVAPSFTDVPASAWYYKYVSEMAQAGVINGYPDGSFKPDGEVTWGEALKLVMKAVGYGDIAPVNDHWASGYMAAAIADLLIPGEVDLNAAITREEIANLAAQALKLAPAAIEYPFEDAAPESAVALYDAGIITGSLDNGQLLFRAESTITRAEMAAIIYRVYNAK